jgi:hypothetical protein
MCMGFASPLICATARGQRACDSHPKLGTAGNNAGCDLVNLTAVSMSPHGLLASAPHKGADHTSMESSIFYNTACTAWEGHHQVFPSSCVERERCT